MARCPRSSFASQPSLRRSSSTRTGTTGPKRDTASRSSRAWSPRRHSSSPTSPASSDSPTIPDIVLAYRFLSQNPLERHLPPLILCAVDRGLGLSLVLSPSTGSDEGVRGRVVGVEVPKSGLAFVAYELLAPAGLPGRVLGRGDQFDASKGRSIGRRRLRRPSISVATPFTSTSARPCATSVSPKPCHRQSRNARISWPLATLSVETLDAPPFAT
jgi:hypothetical protein